MASVLGSQGAHLRDVEQRLETIKSLNPSINAMLCVYEGEARRQAIAADDAAGRDERQGLLHGMTVSLKDAIDVAGQTTTLGSRRFARHSNADAHLVARLRQQGPVIVGKNNLSEFCYGSTNENDHYGPCRNPWDSKRVSGGSSGGSAAAVAAGFTSISFGTDTGGSIRIPASLCGVVGLRPSIGRVSNSGCLPCSADFDVAGPLGRSVSEVARAYVAAAGYDANDPQSVDIPVGDVLSTLQNGLGPCRIGIPRSFYFDDVAPDIVSGVTNAAKVLEGAGATLVDVTIADAELAQARIGFTLFAADMAQYHRDKIEEHPDDIGRDVLSRLKLGLAVTADEYIAARRWLADWKVHLRHVLEGVDVILTPTTPSIAPLLAHSQDMIAATKALSRLTYGFGAVGLPALSLPCGFSSDKLPIGLQLVGRRFDEAMILRAGFAYQQRTEFHRLRPPRPSG